MNKKIQEVLKNIVSEEKLIYLCGNYNELKNQSLVSIGLDSMEYIAFISELEEVLGIDIEEFDKLNTLQNVEDIINERR